jgi:hypothetical protein
MTYFQKNGNKYRAKSTIYNDICYHSKFEAAYAEALDLSLKAGDILKWERQVRLPLEINGYHITNYYIDFIVYHLDGSREFVETKGFQTPEWQMKWRILEATFDQQFKHDSDDCMTLVKQTSWGPPNRRKLSTGKH